MSDWQALDRAMAAVLELPEDQRSSFLVEQTPEVRSDVERLLAAYRRDGKFQGDESGTRTSLPDLLITMQSMLARAGSATVSMGSRPDLAGRTVSHYTIIEKLGAGGMGIVYKAFDSKLDRLVALKFLPPQLSHYEELKRRLSEEARAASVLDHPNIVVIHDIDETPEGDLFIAMAYHQGDTLKDRIASGVSITESLQIARQIASGLAKAHEHNLIHRDIKPGNVIVAKDGVTRIIDFGLAKSSDATATIDGTTKGTPIYMSPEQASGKAVDHRTDLWSLGAVLYEMLAGEPPFRGETQLQVMRAIVNDRPAALPSSVPPGVAAIVTRALERDPARRYQSAADLVRDLSAALAAIEAPKPQRVVRAVYVIPAVAAILFLAAAAVWSYVRSERRHWAREQAIPEIERLAAAKKRLAAYQLLQQAERYLPGDPQLAKIAGDITHVATVNSTPTGTLVEIKDYVSPGDPWFTLGTTPLKDVRIPKGYLRWRISKAGVGEYIGAPIPDDIHGPTREFTFPLDAMANAPPGMVPVLATTYEDLVFALGDLGPWKLPLFYIDRLEVTNRDYQKFVDQGGYQKREYWREKFIRDGRELTWEQAMDLLRDSSGRPGPSTWDAGHYPAGKDDYPVGGVSWYEASAYAEFSGKSLPVVAQWFLAAPSSLARFIVPLGNFTAAPAPAGQYQALGPFGTYDMAGNVAEWSRTEAVAGFRYQLGGGFNTTTNEYFEPGYLPPFHRAANAGFRLVKNTGPLPAEAMAAIRPTIQDFSKAKPASDEAFQIIRNMYAYDHTPLNAKEEPVEQDSADWQKKKITLDAAYGNERLTLYLFVPKNVHPPYQTVVFFPSARVLDIEDSKTLGDMQFIDYVIKNGRAVLYPVYKGTYERKAPMSIPTTAAGRESLIQESKDVGRSLDYLETLPDFDRNKIAYMGVSWGAADGVIFTGVEPRFKAVLFLDGGFFFDKTMAGTNQADFAPRIKAPTLLVAGKFDWIFTGKDALVRLLGAAEADKKVVFLDTAHDVSEQRPDLMRNVVGWLDQYFGKVN
jgi:eukaryotic-like serine/threonine-protein kinase